MDQNSHAFMCYRFKRFSDLVFTTSRLRRPFHHPRNMGWVRCPNTPHTADHADYSPSTANASTQTQITTSISNTTLAAGTKLRVLQPHSLQAAAAFRPTMHSTTTGRSKWWTLARPVGGPLMSRAQQRLLTKSMESTAFSRCNFLVSRALNALVQIILYKVS